MNEINDIRSRSHSYLAFLLGEEKFAAHVAHVNIILEIPKITKVPRTPEYMKGVINHRGMVLPVFDLRVKMSMPENEYTTNTCILVLEIEVNNEQISIGAIVDAVKEVLEIKEENILPPPNIGTNKNEKFIYGIAKINEQFIMLLDMNKIFSTQETVEIAKEMRDINLEEPVDEVKDKKSKGKKLQKSIDK